MTNGNPDRNPASVFSAAFFDGRSARKLNVNIQLTPSGLLVETDDGSKTSWPYAGLRARRDGGERAALNLERDVAGAEGVCTETLVVQHPDFARRLKEVAPSAFSGPLGSSFDPRATARVVATLAVLAPLCAYLLFKFLLPAFADSLAARIPLAVEEKLGRAMLAQLKLNPEAKVDDETRVAMEAIAARLLQATPASRYHFRFMVKEGMMVNAVALPGGYIVVGRGLLNLTDSAEELAGILAHELQHILLRHAMRGLVRDLGMKMIITLVMGGDHEVLSTLLGAAVGLESLRFSRDMERAADQEGMRLLQAAAVDPQGMVAIFVKLREVEQELQGTPEMETEEGQSEIKEKKGEKTASWMSYFRTHPASDERLEYLKKLAALPAPNPEPLLPDFEWHRIHHSPDGPNFDFRRDILGEMPEEH